MILKMTDLNVGEAVLIRPVEMQKEKQLGKKVEYGFADQWFVVITNVPSGTFLQRLASRAASTEYPIEISDEGEVKASFYARYSKGDDPQPTHLNRLIRAAADARGKVKVEAYLDESTQKRSWRFEAVDFKFDSTAPQASGPAPTASPTPGGAAPAYSVASKQDSIERQTSANNATAMWCADKAAGGKPKRTTWEGYFDLNLGYIQEKQAEPEPKPEPEPVAEPEPEPAKNEGGDEESDDVPF